MVYRLKRQSPDQGQGFDPSLSGKRSQGLNSDDQPLFFSSLATCWFRRSGPRQPARRRLHQRPAAAQPRPAEDHRDGGRRRPAVRHLAAAARQPRLRLEDPQQIPGSTPGILCYEVFYTLLDPGLAL